MHTTTNTKPPDIRVDDCKAARPRWIMPGTAGFFPYQFRKTRHGRKLEEQLGPGIIAPPRRASLLRSNTESSVVNVTTEGEISDHVLMAEDVRFPELPQLIGSTETEVGIDPESVVNINNSPAQRMRNPDSHLFTGSTQNECRARSPSPSKRIEGSSPLRESAYFSNILLLHL